MTEIERSKERYETLRRLDPLPAKSELVKAVTSIQAAYQNEINRLRENDIPLLKAELEAAQTHAAAKLLLSNEFRPYLAKLGYTSKQASQTVQQAMAAWHQATRQKNENYIKIETLKDELKAFFSIDTTNLSGWLRKKQLSPVEYVEHFFGKRYAEQARARFMSEFGLTEWPVTS